MKFLLVFMNLQKLTLNLNDLFQLKIRDESVHKILGLHFNPKILRNITDHPEKSLKLCIRTN